MEKSDKQEQRKLELIILEEKIRTNMIKRYINGQVIEGRPALLPTS